MYLSYELTGPIVKQLLHDWKAVGMLYQPVLELATVINGNPTAVFTSVHI